MKNQKGFSLIELLIVVVIIGIIAAIAIPNLLAARRSANEGSAVSAIRNLHSSQTTFQATNGNGDYSGNLGELGPEGTTCTPVAPRTTCAGLIDRSLAGAIAGGTAKSGYNFETEMTGGTGVGTPNPATFHVSAVPSATSGVTQTGTRRFGTTQVGLVYADSLAANIGTQFTYDTLNDFDTGVTSPLPDGTVMMGQ